MKHYFVIFLLLFCSQALNSQTVITGKVISENENLPYVNIQKLNSLKGTISNNNGEFALHNVNKTDTFRFSMLGYKLLDTVFAHKLDEIIIRLEPSSITIPEIDVTALGAESIIKKVNENFKMNYPDSVTAFDALFRKQILQNDDYIFLGNAHINVLCPSYFIFENDKLIKQNQYEVFLKNVKLTKCNLEGIECSVSSSEVIDLLYPQYGFILFYRQNCSQKHFV